MISIRRQSANFDSKREDTMAGEKAGKWREDGVKVISAGQLDSNTPQTAGMTRETAINHARAGANKIWAGRVVIHADAKTAPHHHGPLESVIYVISGRARMRWGESLEFFA